METKPYPKKKNEAHTLVRTFLLPLLLGLLGCEPESPFPWYDEPPLGYTDSLPGVYVPAPQDTTFGSLQFLNTERETLFIEPLRRDSSLVSAFARLIDARLFLLDDPLMVQSGQVKKKYVITNKEWIRLGESNLDSIMSGVMVVKPWMKEMVQGFLQQVRSSTGRRMVVQGTWYPYTRLREYVFVALDIQNDDPANSQQIRFTTSSVESIRIGPAIWVRVSAYDP